MPIRPSTPFERFTINFGGGLSTRNAPSATGESELREAKNVAVVGEGFLSPRKSYKELFAAPGIPYGLFRFPYGTTTVGVATVGVGAIGVFNNAGTLYLYAIAVDGRVGAQLGNMGVMPGDYPYRSVQLTGAVLNSKLFITDEARRFPLTVYDPVAATVTQPEFDFDGDYDSVAVTGDKGKMYPRLVTEYNNMIFAAGYGGEKTADKNRPEIIRFSYLGLDGTNDTGAGGDAGKDINGTVFPTGMGDTFAREDYFMVTERGTPVVSMSPAAGRLLLCTPFQTYSLYGFDRNSFKVELVDAQRGCITSRAMVSAHGTAYWWSNVGPVRYGTGGVEEIGANIREKFSEINQTVFAFHNPETEEVIWFVEGNEDAFVTRALCFNYRYNAWTVREYLGQFFAAGNVSPVYADLTTGAISSPAGPSAAPNTYSTTGKTDTSATGNWVNGDATAQTEVYLDDKIQAAVDTGVTSYKFTGLDGSTTYTVKVRHVKNGKASNYLQGSFTTEAPGFVPLPPENASSTLIKEVEAQTETVYHANVKWDLGQSGVKTKVHMGTTAAFTPDDSNLMHTTDVDVTEHTVKYLNAGAWYFKVAHVNTSSGAVSSYVSAGSVTVP